MKSSNLGIGLAIFILFVGSVENQNTNIIAKAINQFAAKVYANSTGQSIFKFLKS